MSESACRLTIFNIKFQFKTSSLRNRKSFILSVQHELYLTAQRCQTQGHFKVECSYIHWDECRGSGQNLTYYKLIIPLQSLVLSLNLCNFCLHEIFDSQYICVVPFNIKKMICTPNPLVKLTFQENIPVFIPTFIL